VKTPRGAFRLFFQVSQQKSIIDMQSTLKANYRLYPGDQSDMEMEIIQAFGKCHRARGWEPHLDPRWTPFQKGAYYRGYDEE
jgi:hypothetical protein